MGAFLQLTATTHLGLHLPLQDPVNLNNPPLPNPSELRGRLLQLLLPTTLHGPRVLLSRVLLLHRENRTVEIDPLHRSTKVLSVLKMVVIRSIPVSHPYQLLAHLHNRIRLHHAFPRLSIKSNPLMLHPSRTEHLPPMAFSKMPL
jgi:hypothetical protein